MLYNFLPTYMGDFFINEIYSYRKAHEYFINFFEENPGAFENLHNQLELSDVESRRLLGVFKHTIEEYQAGLENYRKGEYYLLDEGFTMRAVSTLWRTNRNVRDIDTYFESYFSSFPKPNIIVSVSAPVKICLNRQRNRTSRKPTATVGGDNLFESQRKHHKLCNQAIDYLNKTSEVDGIIEVENTSSIEHVVDEVEDGLAKYIYGWYTVISIATIQIVRI